MPSLLLLAPLLIIAVSIPLMLEKVPRNRWYGFRTPKTLSSDTVWYPANKIGGKYFVVAGSIQLAALGIVWFIYPDAVLTYGGPVVAIPLLIAVALWFVRLRHI